MTMKLLTSVATVAFLAGSTAVLAAPSPVGQTHGGDPGRILVAQGDPNHDHDDGPPGQNLDGENGRPGYGYGDAIHDENDGPPGRGNDFPGWGGPPD